MEKKNQTLFLEDLHQPRTSGDVEVVATVLSVTRRFPPDFASRERPWCLSFFISVVKFRWRRLFAVVPRPPLILEPVHFSMTRNRFDLIFSDSSNNLASGRDREGEDVASNGSLIPNMKIIAVRLNDFLIDVV